MSAFNTALTTFTLDHADSVSRNWLHTAFVFLHRTNDGTQDSRRERTTDQLFRLPQAGRGNRQDPHGDPRAIAGACEVAGLGVPAVAGTQRGDHQAGGIQHVGGQGDCAAMPFGVTQQGGEPSGVRREAPLAARPEGE